MPRTAAQLDQEIKRFLTSRPRHANRPATQHPHATRKPLAQAMTAQPYLDGLIQAIRNYRASTSEDERARNEEVVISAAQNGQKYVNASRRINKAILARGEILDRFDPAIHELMNMLVGAKELVRRIKIKRKTGQYPKTTRETDWKMRTLGF